MSTEEDIRKASDKFYAALNITLNGDWKPTADALVTQSERYRNAPY